MSDANVPAPIVGSIYQDGAPAFKAQPVPWDVRDTTIARLHEDLAAVFDDADERRIKALLEVLDWHQPWMGWEQVFAPYFIGTRFEGQRCRSCNAVGERPCPTVTAVARAMGIEA